MTLRRPICLAILGALAFVGVAHGQIVVYDPTNYAKLVQQAETALQQLQQMQKAVANGQTLLSSLNTNSGVNNLAPSLAAPALRDFLPAISAYVSAEHGGLTALGVLSSSAESIRSQNRLYTPQGADPIEADVETQGDRAARDLAAGQAVSAAAQSRLVGLQQLQTALTAAGDARAALDLQARIQAEQAMIANDQMRLQGLTITSAAEDRLQQQRDRERMEAERDARIALYKAAFQ